MIIINLIQNIALLVALAATYQVIGSRFKQNSIGYKILSGLLFGGVGVVGMMTPLNLIPGIIFDGRSIILSVSGLFGGPLVAVIAATMCGAYRLWLGGAGAWVGVGVIVEATALGLLFYFLWERNARQISAFTLWIFGLLVHVVMLALMLVLPGGSGPKVLRQIGLPVLIIYPLATMVVCQIFLDYKRQFLDREALRQSEQKYRHIFETSIEGIFQSAPDGRLILVNPAFAKMFGYGSTDEMLREVTDIAHQLYGKPEEREPLTCRLSDPGFIEGYEVECRRKDGTPMWISVNAKAIRDESGRIIYYEGTSEDITARKKAEEALRKSEALLNSIIEQSPFSMWISDNEGTLIRINPACKKWVRVRDEDVVGKYNVLKDEAIDAQGFMPMVRRVFENGEQANFELDWDSTLIKHLRHKEAFKLILFVTIFPVKDAEGRITNAVCQHIDITDRKQAQEELQQSEQRYRAIFNIASVGIDLVDQQGRFLEVNGTFAQFLSYAPEEIRDLTILDVTHPEDLDRSKKMHEAIVRGDTESYRMEKRYVRKDGAVLWADVAVSAIRDAEGQYRATVGVIRDITQQKKSEEARVRLAAAVEQAAETVVITDPQGTILYANPAFERITGYSRDEALGNNPRILKSGHHDDEFYKRMWDTVTNGQIWTGHFLNRRKDGTLFEEDASISPVKDDSGAIINYVAVKRDITQEVLLQRQLFQAQKMEAIGTLAGGIAHDFNNLLTVMHGFSELLLAEKDPKHPEYADLKKILHAAQSGAELVRRLLMFSRKAEPKPVPMNLNKQIVQVEKLLRRTIPRMVDISLDLSPDLPAINADPSQVEQVLMNLAVNARDAMPDVGKLTVRTSLVTLDEDYCRTHVEAVPGEYVVLEVADTGHGMDRETVEHIFEPFFTTKEMGRGTGLGLAMVYGIVKQHNGHITVYSEVGIGTTFRVYLPTIPTNVEPEVEDTGIMPAFGTETVLLVDDEEFVRELGARILSKHGYTVLPAVNGREALDLFRKERSRISLVILDLIMPEMGGTECLKELLQIDPQVNVLVASGFSADASVRKTVQMGAKGFVSKPFRVKELLRDVRRVLDQG